MGDQVGQRNRLRILDHRRREVSIDRPVTGQLQGRNVPAAIAGASALDEGFGQAPDCVGIGQVA
jgi:hypothetical protein